MSKEELTIHVGNSLSFSSRKSILVDNSLLLSSGKSITFSGFLALLKEIIFGSNISIKWQKLCAAYRNVK